MRFPIPAWSLLLLPLAAFPAGAQEAAVETAAVDPAAVDAIFERFDGTDTPGCAVGVSEGGEPVLFRAYGMADLEHDVVNTPETVFEPGSVAKQFTAAATIVLALDGKLSLDDDVREYIPELPDYGEPITIRHLINHTSGLRDWGSIAGIGGWPRTTRVHTHTHVLDIASRQRSLNYDPGRYYSYTNTGYNLQAILVERVTGTSFADFSKERLFEPLGMTRTEWRDDFTRIVKDRSVAYGPNGEGGWRMLMPFENVHGNGGLLTTVGDLLRWTRNLETGEVGGPEFIAEMHRQGVLDSGRTIAYASGLFIGEYRGVREVQHSGGTAAYRGFLTRFPDHGIAVAVMCNAGNANPGRFAHEVSDLYLGDVFAAAEEATEAAVAGDAAGPGVELPAARLEALAGGYRDSRMGAFLRLDARGGTLRAGGLELTPVSDTEFRADNGIVIEFEDPPATGGRPAAIMDTPVADDVRLEPVGEFDPTPEELAEYVGSYRSDEAEATYTVAIDDGALAIRDRYGEGFQLDPTYPDAFRGRGSTYIFRRDAAGRVTGLSLGEGRVWDLRFERLPS